MAERSGSKGTGRHSHRKGSSESSGGRSRPGSNPREEEPSNSRTRADGAGERRASSPSSRGDGQQTGRGSSRSSSARVEREGERSSSQPEARESRPESRESRAESNDLKEREHRGAEGNIQHRTRTSKAMRERHRA